MNTQDTLLAYSEWLDGEGLVVADSYPEDKRTHEDLVKEFIEKWEATPGSAVLSGRDVQTPREWGGR